MLPHCIGTLEVLCLFVLTGDAQIADLYLLLKVLDQSLWIFAELSLGYEETMGILHVLFVLLQAGAGLEAEEAPFVVFLEGRGLYRSLDPRFYNSSRVVPLGGDVLIERFERSKRFPK